MFKILQGAFNFLTEVAHLWDAHWKRTTDAKRIVRKHLENTIMQNDINIQVNFEPLASNGITRIIFWEGGFHPLLYLSLRSNKNRELLSLKPIVYIRR